MNIVSKGTLISAKQRKQSAYESSIAKDSFCIIYEDEVVLSVENLGKIKHGDPFFLIIAISENPASPD